MFRQNRRRLPTLPRRVAVVGVMLALLGTGSLRAQVSATPSPTSPSDPQDLVKQGQQLDRDGKHPEALALYRQALQLSPNLFQAQLAAGMSLDLTGQFKEARQYLEKAIAAAPSESQAQAFRTMAVSYAFTGNANEAARFERQAIDVQMAAHNPSGAAEVADELARIYLELGNPKAAMKWYRTGHDTARQMADPSDSAKDLWEFRWEHAQARIAAREGHAAEAMQHVTAAKAILDRGHIPGQARFFPYLTGYVAFYGGDNTTAIADLQKADQQDPFILCLLAQAYEKSGDRTQATAYYQKALASNAHSPTNAFARPLATRKLADMAG